MASAFQYQWNNYLKSGGSKLVELFRILWTACHKGSWSSMIQ